MAGRSAFEGGRIYRRQPRPWLWLLSGLIIGGVIGWSSRSLLPEPIDVEPLQTSTTPRPTPNPQQMLRLVAQAPDGIVLKAGAPLKLTGSGSSQLAEQKDKNVLIGLRNWSSTVRYLTSGEAVLFFRDSENIKVTGGWRAGDYRNFVRGEPLQLKVKPGETYTLYFRRAGSEPINLGGFRVGPADEVVSTQPTASASISTESE